MTTAEALREGRELVADGYHEFFTAVPSELWDLLVCALREETDGLWNLPLSTRLAAFDRAIAQELDR